MKNVKINKERFNKKIKYALIPVTLVTTMVLSSCGFLPNGNNARYKEENLTNNNSVETTVQESVCNDIEFDSNIAMSSVGDNTPNQTFISFNDNNLNEFLSYLKGVNVRYDYENLYKLNESLNEYNKLNISENHTNKKFDISVDDLSNIVNENNKKYLNNAKTSVYKELETKELNSILEITVQTVNDFIKQNKNISKDRIKCVLSDLKVFKQESALCNAFVSDDNCLIISPNMLQIAKLMKGEETDTDILIHEINHLLQKGCNCDLELNSNLKRNFGFCYGFKNIEINSLDFAWFYEAAAEKNMSNYTGHEPLVYASKIGYLESLSLVNVLNENYSVNDTEKLSFSRKLDDLYSYFNVTTDEDKLEILKLMYSINVIQEAPDDFYKLYQNNTGIIKDDKVLDDVNYTIKSSVCQTLTKLFYKNLAISITNKQVTLQDVFYLISLFENDINNHILYDSQELYNYNESFINEYINIQDNFFYQLSKLLNCSQEDVDSLFNSYSAKIRTSDNNTLNNYTLAFLSKEKVNYLNERQEFLSDIATVNIKEVNNVFTCNNQKKY